MNGRDGEGVEYDDEGRFDYMDDAYDNSEECWDCGGEGFDDLECECEAFEDICMCAEPTPRRCRTCGGSGYLDRTD